MTQATLKRLIDLPGIDVIERGLSLKNALWAPENDDIEDRIKRYSIQHFGRTTEGTAFPFTDGFWDHYDDLDDGDGEDAPTSGPLADAWAELRAFRVWERNFEPLQLELEEQQPLWTALGWDISNGAGDFAHSFAHFGRQLLAFAKGLPIQGGETVETVEAVKVEDWGASLEAEARKFRGSGSPRR